MPSFSSSTCLLVLLAVPRLVVAFGGAAWAPALSSLQKTRSSQFILPERQLFSRCKGLRGGRLKALSLTCSILSEDDAQSAHKAVISQTREWVEKIIVGLNLCPYAKVPLAKDTIRYSISDARDGDALVEDVLAECAELLDADPAEAATTLMMAPGWASDLQDWFEVGAYLEDFLDDDNDPIFNGKAGVAFFHPAWTFEELEDRDPTHYERRAPWPSVSLVRKEDVGAKVKEALGKGINLSKKIQDDNAATLAKVGFEKLSQQMRDIQGKPSS